MAYNNGFPMNYPQYTQQYPQQYQQPIPTPQPQINQNQNNPIIWVSGEAGAKAFLVAPNTTVQLWDSENPVIFLKSADASGMPSMKILDYTIREGEKPQNTPLKSEMNNYATKEELNAFRSEILQTIEKVKGDLGA
jgi:hypothetical protein